MHPLRSMVMVGLLLTACAPHNAGSSSGTSSGASRTVLRADEIKTIDVANAYDAVARLRPAWLRRRGPISPTHPDAGYAVAYVDGLNVGAASALARVPVSSVVEIEYLSGADATTRFGAGHDGGAILVRTH